jgi:hypothetical protein
MYRMYRLAITTLGFVVFFLLQAVAGAANLLVNGDFTLGNTGFTSDYVFTSDTQPEGTYCVDTNPHDCHPGGTSYGDHTSGHGLMLNANGSVSPNQIVWQETVTVIPHTPYTFSGWAASWGNVGGDLVGVDPSPARLRFFINGIQVGQDFAVATQNGQWLQFVTSWPSESNTSATIAIVDGNVDAFGNDFSLDDLSLQVEPCTLNLEASSPDGSLRLAFEVGTGEPATWNAWLTSQAEIARLFSVSLPVIEPPIAVSLTLPFFPTLGTIGGLTTLTTPDTGIRCAAFTTVDTGSPTAASATLQELVEPHAIELHDQLPQQHIQ